MTDRGTGHSANQPRGNAGGGIEPSRLDGRVLDCSAHGQRLDDLRARGAHRQDPVRFRFLEALARRAALQVGDVRRLLDRRLDAALEAFSERHVATQPSPEPAAARRAVPPPRSADRPQSPRETADSGRTGPLSSPGLVQTPLAALVDHLNQRASALADAAAWAAGAENGPLAPGGAPTAELRSLRRFRGTWTQLSIELQLSRSLAKAPENPGPFNSHGLVLRSLQTMQDISPAYLHQFMSYVDSLLWLDQTRPNDARAPSLSAGREAATRRSPGTGPRPPAG